MIPSGSPVCSKAQATCGRPTICQPMWSSSTPARYGRTPITASTAVSGTSGRRKKPGLACRSRSAVVWRRKTAARSSAARPGSMWFSAPIISARFPSCWSGPGSSVRRRSRSLRRSRPSLPTCPPGANLRTPPGCQSASAAVTPAPSASCRPCVEGRRIGVQEVTLLGQNVNAYGLEFRDRGAFAKLLRACGSIDGLERVRFTSPHPKDFTDDVIIAMAETPNVMPSLHMPLQSGSDSILKVMRRSYRSERYLAILDRVRTAMPEAAITTDIIVGFPGETEQDFQATLDVVRAARFSAAFTFQYSIRPGTPAATMAGQVPQPVVQERYERLVDLVNETAWRENLSQVGRRVEVMFADGEGRKDAFTHRMSGRARDNRLVHVTVPEEPAERPRPGDLAEMIITYAAPHYLNADGGLVALRRTRGGDAWQASRSVSETPASTSVNVGMPTVGAPAIVQAAETCLAH